jgi:glycosyltransferase involved in cell wall biosynthesis
MPRPRLTRALVLCPVVPYPPVTGSQKRTLRLLEAMERVGATPHILTEDTARAAEVEALRARGWSVDVLPDRPPTLRRRVAQHARRFPSPFVAGLARRTAELAPAAGLIEVEHTQAAYYGRALGGRPWILSTHNVDSQLWRTLAEHAPRRSRRRLALMNRASATAAMERRSAPRASATLCVSESDAAVFSRLGARVVLVPNGVDASFFAVERESREDAVLFFGLLDYGPNAIGMTRFLREGWPCLRELRPNARLRIAGGSIEADLASLAEATPGVELLGRVPSLEPELARASVSVVPIWQGAGTRLKVIESLAAGCPVVGTPLGVENVGFRDGEHGLLAGEPAELAAAAAAVLGDPERAASLGRAGREHVRRYEWSVVLAPAEELYAEQLAQAAGRRGR